MLANIQYENFENEIRYLYDAKNRIVVTLGMKSYIAKSRADYGGNSHILMGNYCSIAHDVCFIIGMNHSMDAVSTYPEELIGTNALELNNDEQNISDIKNSYQICIGHDVWIGEKAVILGGVKIGNGAVIAAAAVVTKDVPPYAIVGGNPAKILRYRFEPDIIHKLQKIKWWYWDESQIIERKKQLNDVKQFVKDYYQCNQCYQIENDLSESLQKLSNEQGCKLYYFIPDFDLQDGVWSRVIRQFIQLYTNQDNIVLLLELRDKQLYHEKINVIFKWLSDKGVEAPLVVEVDSQKNGVLSILQNIDAFITTKEYSSVQCIDYGYDYNVKICCGLNKNVFDT